MKMFAAVMGRVAQVRYVPEPVRQMVQMYPRLVLRAVQSVFAFATIFLSASSVGDHFVFTLLHILANIVFAGTLAICLCDGKFIMQSR